MGKWYLQPTGNTRVSASSNNVNVQPVKSHRDRYRLATPLQPFEHFSSGQKTRPLSSPYFFRPVRVQPLPVENETKVRYRRDDYSFFFFFTSYLLNLLLHHKREIGWRLVEALILLLRSSSTSLILTLQLIKYQFGGNFNHFSSSEI